MSIALITGVSRRAGIGWGIAQALAQAGNDIFITYFRPYDAETGLGSGDEPAEMLAELRNLGVRAQGIELDLADPSAPDLLFSTATKQLGHINILVNNATVSFRDGIENLTADFIDKHYAVNMRGMMLLCAEFVKQYQPNSLGRIINISSGQSFGPMPEELAYVATKGAVEAFSLTLSAEVARRGITVNAIDPGATDTGWIDSETLQQWNEMAPFGRVGQPRDVANLVAFLASDKGQWITGQLIRSRGGT